MIFLLNTYFFKFESDKKKYGANLMLYRLNIEEGGPFLGSLIEEGKLSFSARLFII